jgi:hypothetical protein
MLAVLDKVALQKGEYFAKGEKVGTNIRGRLKVEGMPVSYGDWGWQEWKYNTEKLPMDNDAKNTMSIVVNTARSGANERTTWRWFQVSRIEKLFKHDKNTVDVNRIEVAVLFLDKGKNEISRDQFVVAGDMVPGLFTTRQYADTEIVSPFIRDDFHFCPSMKIKRTLTFSASELEKVGPVILPVLLHDGLEADFIKLIVHAPATSLRCVHAQDRLTDPLPVMVVESFLLDLRDRRDVCVRDGVFVIAVEADGRTPAKAESRSAKRTHRLGGLGIQAELAHEGVELLPGQQGDPLAVFALLPTTFEVSILKLFVAFGQIPEATNLRRGIVPDAHALGYID